jgi:hypothetical protein
MPNRILPLGKGKISAFAGWVHPYRSVERSEIIERAKWPTH